MGSERIEIKHILDPGLCKCGHKGLAQSMVYATHTKIN